MPEEHLAQLEMKRHRSTEKALLLSDDGEIENAVWLPRSQLSITPAKTHGHYIVTMPEWLALKNNLI